MLEFKDFSLSFVEDEVENRILEDINLKFEKGSINVITGRSGCGKSSLIKTINGIIPEVDKAKLEGDILLDGESILKTDITDRSRFISTVFQNPKNQFYAINSLDEIAFALENRNISREKIYEKIEYFSKLLNSQDLLGKDLFKLSGGQKQLIAINSVAVMDNEIYIFDEPSASLDRESIEKLTHCLEVLKSMGKIIIIAEHRLYYLKEIMDRLLLIENRKILSYSKDRISEEILEKYRLRTLKDIEKEELISKSYEVKNLFDDSFDEGKSLICRDFTCQYEKNPKLFDFSMSFDPGIYFIIGANGIGKSSFIRNLCGLNKKQKGEVFYKNKIIKNHGDYISLVMQDVNYQLFTESVLTEMKIVADDEKKIEEILKKLELWNRKESHPQKLSGGEKQRLALGLAMASPKEIVVLDEPTSGLCFENMKRLIDILKEMKDEGKTIIVISHDYEFIKNSKENIVEFV